MSDHYHKVCCLLYCIIDELSEHNYSLCNLRFLQPAIGTFSRYGSIHTMHELHVHAYGRHQKTALFVSHEYNNITLGSENHSVRFVQWNFV